MNVVSDGRFGVYVEEGANWGIEWDFVGVCLTERGYAGDWIWRP